MHKNLLLCSIFTAGIACSSANLEQANVGTKTAPVESNKAQNPNASGDTTQDSNPGSSQDTVLNSGSTQHQNAPSKQEGGISQISSFGSESADHPISITGAYLYCINLLDATDASLTTVIGCHYTGTELSSNYNIQYSLTLAEVPGAAYTQNLLPNLDLKNNVIFQFSALSSAASIQASRESKVAIKLKDLTTGLTETKPDLKIGSILNPKSNTADFKQTAFDGTELFHFVDMQTGLKWSVDSGQSFTFSDAKQFCDSFGVGDSQDWRLPTIIELQTIFGSDPTSVVGFNISSQRYGGYWSSTNSTGPNSAWRVNFGTIEISSGTNSIDANVAQSVLCVQ